MVIEKIKINKNNRNDEGNVQNCVKNKENKKKNVPVVSFCSFVFPFREIFTCRVFQIFEDFFL